MDHLAPGDTVSQYLQSNSKRCRAGGLESDGPTKGWLPKKKLKFEEFLRLITVQTLKLQANLVDDAAVTKDQAKTFRRITNMNLEELEKF